MVTGLLRIIKDSLTDGTTGLSAIKTVANNIYSRLGAPAGASMAADIAAVKAETDLIKGYIDTEVAALQTDLTIVKNRLSSTQQKVVPTLAAPTTVTGAAGAWGLGGAATPVAANGIAADFCIDGVQVEAAPASTGELVLYHGAGATEFARVRITTQGIFPVFSKKTIPANDQITAKLATSAGGSQTANISLSYHLV